MLRIIMKNAKLTGVGQLMKYNNKKGNYLRKSLAATAIAAALSWHAPTLAVDGSSIVKGHIEASTGSDIIGATLTF